MVVIVVILVFDLVDWLQVVSRYFLKVLIFFLDGLWNIGSAEINQSLEALIISYFRVFDFSICMLVISLFYPIFKCFLRLLMSHLNVFHHIDSSIFKALLQLILLLLIISFLQFSLFQYFLIFLLQQFDVLFSILKPGAFSYWIWQAWLIWFSCGWAISASIDAW